MTLAGCLPLEPHLLSTSVKRAQQAPLVSSWEGTPGPGARLGALPPPSHPVSPLLRLFAPPEVISDLLSGDKDWDSGYSRHTASQRGWSPETSRPRGRTRTSGLPARPAAHPKGTAVALGSGLGPVRRSSGPARLPARPPARL